jgi:CheY-like chemotaxis protein
LENLKIPHLVTDDKDVFEKALFQEEWSFIFSGYGLYEEIKPLMEQPDTAFFGGKKPPLALMVEWGTEAYIPNVRFVSLPVQSLSIANVLNGKEDSKSYFNSTASNNGIRFTIPQARLLVVDDIATNLKVAEGLLSPYQAKIDTCLSGEDAIELVKRHNYDLILMDHMMPVMDGIEATAAIRAWEAERNPEHPVPIVALTANAISGMREMFIEKGFNDFLAKPVDISKLDEILSIWIPKEKRVTGNNRLPVNPSPEQTSDSTADIQNSSLSSSTLPSIPGVDIQYGITMTGGTLALYRQVLSIYRKDAQERLPLLQTTPSQDALPAFVTQVHALKSASASIGAEEVSDLAEELEHAGKAGDLTCISKQLPVFVKCLDDLIEGINAWEKSNEEQAGTPEESSDIAPVLSLLEELTTALKSQNVSEIDRISDELGNKSLDAKTKEALDQISDHVLMAEFENALEITRGLLNRVNEGPDE